MVDLQNGNCESIIKTLKFISDNGTIEERKRYLNFYIECLDFETKNKDRWTVIKALTSKINKLKQNTQRV
jgi:hypothetical protein